MSLKERQLWKRNATDIVSLLKNKDISPKEALDSILSRIKETHKSINAVITLCEERAKKKITELSNNSVYPPGYLYGLPVVIKDLTDVSGVKTTYGSKIYGDFIPKKSDYLVERIESMGGIIIGKTNTPEFTLSFQTDNLIYGKTSNPYNLAMTPGGSSGGAAALIAANAIPFDIGTDTGGSIRLPAHFCGIVGLKPTTGRVPCTGNALPSSGLIAPLSQVGPLARYVDDLDLLMTIIL